MTNTQTVEQAALGELTAVIGRIEALSPAEARQAYERLGACIVPVGQVDRLALATLDRMLSERAAAPDLDTEASGKLERIRHNFSRLDNKPPAERSPEDKEELPY